MGCGAFFGASAFGAGGSAAGGSGFGAGGAAGAAAAVPADGVARGAAADPAPGVARLIGCVTLADFSWAVDDVGVTGFAPDGPDGRGAGARVSAVFAPTTDFRN